MFPSPLKDPSEIDQLQQEGAVSRLTYVGDAITLTRHKIEGKVPLIGFTGAPVSKDLISKFKARKIKCKNLKVSGISKK